MVKEYIEREAAVNAVLNLVPKVDCDGYCWVIRGDAARAIDTIPAADVRPVSEIEKIIESLQEQADLYNARAKELLVEEDGQVSQYTWAVSLRETYRRIIKTLDDLIS